MKLADECWLLHFSYVAEVIQQAILALTAICHIVPNYPP